jgi:Chalcone isomerase-like
MPRPTSVFRSIALSLAAIMAVLGGQAHATSLPDEVLTGNYSLQRVGAGQLSWLGRPIYQASLWTPAGSFTGYEPGAPVALSLSYQRKFSRDELLRITSTAWRLLDSTPPDQRERWLATLRTFWSDVGPGDNVTTVVVPGESTRFYDGTGLMGQIDDPAFGPAFLSIWLDSRSVVGDLRVQLLGLESSAARR